MTHTACPLHVGTAGWAVPRAAAHGFPVDGSHLQRYATVLNCAEINSSFNRSHRTEVYARWAEQTAPSFRFAVKLPRAITHDGRLRGARLPLQRFIAQASGLSARLAVLLVQVPPSLVFEARPLSNFFGLLADLFGGAVVCEARHASWFTPAADDWLVKHRISRAAADPARWPNAAVPGGWLGPAGDGAVAGAVVYSRWHGAPRTYWSRYNCAWLQARASELRRWPTRADCWTIFDNTAWGAAALNALEFAALLKHPPPNEFESPVGNAHCPSSLPFPPRLWQERTMSKSGQPATKADTGGQRVPKSRGKTAGSEKEAPKSNSPAKKILGKKAG